MRFWATALLVFWPTLLSSGPIELIGNGLGHACAVEGRVFTARHVVEDFQTGKTYTHRSNYGKMRIVKIHRDRDLAEISLEQKPPSWPLAKSITPGEKVLWWEYNFNNRRDTGKVNMRDARVIRISADHIFFDRQPIPGASGTCLANEKGEVVGIVFRFFQTGAGMAVSLVGTAWPPER